MADEEEQDCCPLCMEELDITDKTFDACPCGYQVRTYALPLSLSRFVGFLRASSPRPTRACVRVPPSSPCAVPTAAVCAHSCAAPPTFSHKGEGKEVRGLADVS